MTHHLYPLSDERSYFFDSLYDHNRLCHGSKTFFRQPDKDQVKLESMFTKIQVLRTSAVGNAWCRGSLCVIFRHIIARLKFCFLFLVMFTDNSASLVTAKY